MPAGSRIALQHLSQRMAGATWSTASKFRRDHRAHFRHAGHEVGLLVTHWKRGLPMLVFRDATAGAETYAATRFLIAEPAGDVITLDFNRAHNPPCAFTDFAICPLPPPENRLPFAIRAGERKLD